LPRVDFGAVATWLLGFLLVAYLGLKGGGYDPFTRNQLGIAIWWGVLLGLAVGALPLNRLKHGSLVALGLLAAYVCWVGLSAGWSSAPAGTVADLGRVVTYLGIFAMALAIRTRKGARRMAAALGAGIMVVAAVALLSRLHPSWFPDARETVNLLSTERSRLGYPLGYWNGVAELIAIGLPLVLYLACSARHVVVQALAAAALPALALTVYFTFSRAGTAAAIVALAAFLAFAHDRIPKAATLLAATAGAGVLILCADQRDALSSGLAGPEGVKQGNELIAITAVVCTAVGAIQAALALALRRSMRPRWSEPSRSATLTTLSIGAAVAVLAVLTLGVSGKISSAWHEFEAGSSVPTGSARFQSFGSNGRAVYWRAALDEFESEPLIGSGSGSFEGWWLAHRGTDGGFVRDAHSLYLETLGELGIVGFALIVGFLGWVLATGVRNCAGASGESRTQLAAALAGCVAFCIGAGFDWLWELAVIPIAFLLLASVLVSAGEQRRTKPLSAGVRLGGALAAVAAMVAIAIPLSAAESLQASRVAVGRGDLDDALTKARDARGVEPFAAEPRLQEALVLEEGRRLTAAEAAAVEATELEPDDWRAWVIRSRLEAERGHAEAALASYRRARALNPQSVLFAR
jgi:O-antigen ligase